MKLCARCNAQFTEEQTHCVHCGGKLSGEGGGPPSPATSWSAEETPRIEGAVLLSARQPIFAIPVLNALAEAEIDFELVADGGTKKVDWIQGSSGHFAQIEILVAAAQLERARNVEAGVLARVLPDLPEGYDPERRTEGECPACGFSASGSEAECPDCGLAFPEDEA